MARPRPAPAPVTTTTSGLVVALTAPVSPLAFRGAGAEYVPGVLVLRSRRMPRGRPSESRFLPNKKPLQQRTQTENHGKQSDVLPRFQGDHAQQRTDHQ